MRITHYLREIDLEHGGIVRFVLDMTTLLAREHDVRLLTFNDKDAPQSWKDGADGVPTIERIEAPSGGVQRYSKTQLGAIEQRLRQTDVLHLHALWNPSNVQLSKLARRMGLPYVCTVHGMLDDWCMSQRSLKKQVFLATGGRAMLEGARWVHLTAQGEYDQAHKRFPRGRGVVVPPVFDLEPYRELPGVGLASEAFGIKPDDRVVLFLSRVNYKKGVDVLVDAAAAMRDRGASFRVLIAGASDEPYGTQVREQTSRLGLDDCVEFVGMVTGDTKTSLYQRADVFALPTSQENFGFVLPESLACGTPVITTKGVDIWPELVGGGGAVTAERDAGAFADAILGLLDDPERARSMGESGRAWVFSDLDPDRTAARLSELYAEAAG